MNLDVVEDLPTTADAIFDAPLTALPVDLSKIQLYLLKGVAWPDVLKKAVPECPQAARASHIQGTVKVRATIGPNGRVESMQVLDGPKILRDAALDAVKQWIYRPFDVMGLPRPVEIDIQVVFTMG